VVRRWHWAIDSIRFGERPHGLAALDAVERRHHCRLQPCRSARVAKDYIQLVGRVPAYRSSHVGIRGICAAAGLQNRQPRSGVGQLVVTIDLDVLELLKPRCQGAGHVCILGAAILHPS